MELTQEYFDRAMTNLLEATKGGIADIRANMATKADLAAVRADMATKADLREAFEIQQVWMDERFNELIVKYDVRERVVKLEKDVAKLKLKSI